MSIKKAFLALAASILFPAMAASAADIDMENPLRALGRENDVRIDAQLMRDTVSPSTPIGVTYQIENLTSSTVAIADKVADASYDVDSRTITFGIGSEVPVDGAMPHMVMIAPGEKKVLKASATPVFAASTIRGQFTVAPRFVQLKVTILRDLAPFMHLIKSQTQTRTGPQLSDDLFDRWLESSNTIFLNTLPVAWSPRDPSGSVDASQRGMRRGGV